MDSACTSLPSVSTIARLCPTGRQNQSPSRILFEHDVLLADTETMIRSLAAKLWSASRKESRTARTVVLKLKTSEFKILTRSHTAGCPPSSSEELTDIALKLRERVVDLGPDQRYRLVGVGLSNFQEPDDAAAQPVLFE